MPSSTTCVSVVGTKGIGAVNAPPDIPQGSQVSAKSGEITPPQVSNATTSENEEFADMSECESSVIEVRVQNKGEVHSKDSGNPQDGSPVSVKGRLKEHLSFWQAIGASQYILSTIEHGYKIPFQSEPSKLFQPNNRSAYMHGSFVNEAINDLLADNRVSEVQDAAQLHNINPLSVAVQPSGKKRLILDLRTINSCLKKYKFKYEDHKKALEYFVPGVFFTKFDLKSGYHHIEIFPPHRQYLGFAWNFGDGVVRYFTFNVLPFGLSTAPYIFTKLLRPLVKLWRSRGLHPIVYLDDGLNIEDSRERAEHAAHHTRGDLFAAGFVVGEDKSEWVPTQVIDWIGITWNARVGSISNCAKRIEKARQLIRKALEHPFISARELAGIVGSIISMGAVVGRLTRIMTRHCQITIAASATWDTRCQLDSYCISELMFWSNHIMQINTKHCFQPVVYHKIVYSDASSFACGALLRNGSEFVCHKMFSEDELSRSSTYRELVTILYALHAFGSLLHNSSIKWFTDNQATAKIVEVGSMKTELQKTACEIFSHCFCYSIDLYIEWIPRELNKQADFISKIRDCDDWQITQGLFMELNELWGPYTVDCFASFYNKKLDRFFSRFWNPGCAGVDAFYQSWTGENCLVVPPVSIVSRVLQYMSSQQCCGTLIVPEWPSASFWPLLWQRYAPHIVDYRYYAGNKCCIHGRNTNSIIGSEHWESRILAIRLSFAQD